MPTPRPASPPPAMPPAPVERSTKKLKISVVVATLASVAGVYTAASSARVDIVDQVPECAGRTATILGTDGDDTIVGTNKRDVIHAGAGADVVIGLAGRDIICGGDGDDIIAAGGGNDYIEGGHGTDEIHGEGGRRDECWEAQIVSGCEFTNVVEPAPTTTTTTTPATTAPTTTAPTTTVPASTTTAPPAPTTTTPAGTTTTTTTTPATTTTTTTTAPTTTVPAPTTTAPSPTTTAPAPTTTAPAPTTTLPPSGGQPPVDIPSNFDVQSYLRPATQIVDSSAWEPTGNFRTICEFSHLAYDDPIVYPNQPGASHLHMFFGNTEANANSDWTSLRTSGDSTCVGGPLNRSAYWMPTLHEPSGDVKIADYLVVYYKDGTEGNRDLIREVNEYPNGLKMLAGGAGLGRHSWQCESGGGQSATIPNCGAGDRVGATVVFPSCWNGTDLDSADHQSHMAYKVRDQHTGQLECPASHPVAVPEYTLSAWFTSDGNTGNWYLSSDRMAGMPTQPNGSTMHADWYGAWDPDIQRIWTQECIRNMMNCNPGQLANGTEMVDGLGYDGPKTLPAPTRASSFASNWTGASSSITDPNGLLARRFARITASNEQGVGNHPLGGPCILHPSVDA